MAINQELGRIPGVRIKEIPNPDLSVASASNRVVGLVASSFTNLLKRDIEVTRNSTSTEDLIDSVLITSVKCISSYQEAYGTPRLKYKEGVDYSVTTDPETGITKISWALYPRENEVYLGDVQALWKSTSPAPSEGSYVYYISDATQYPSATQVEHATVLGNHDESFSDITIGAYTKLDGGKYVSCTSEDEGALQIVDTKKEDFVSGDGYVLGAETLSGSKITTSVTSNSPVAGSKYYVTAEISKQAPEYFEPKEFTNISEVEAEYGYEYDSDTDTVNAMTVLARQLFTAGATRVVCTMVEQENVAGYTKALTKLENVELQYVLCSGSATVDGVNRILMNHVVNMGTVEKSMNRLGFVAPFLTDGKVTANDIKAQVAALKTQLITMVAPGNVLIQVSDQSGDTYVKEVSSIYAVATIVGMLANPNRRLATPLTRKDVTNLGILDLDTYYDKQTIEDLAKNGVTVLIQRKYTNNIVINQGLTTDPSNYANYYLNIVCCKFEQARLLAADLDQTFIGTELLSDTLGLITTFIINVLDGFKGVYFNDYKDLSVARDVNIPTKVNVRYKIQGIFSADYIDITFSVYVA